MITTKYWFYLHDHDELAEGIRRGYQRVKDEGRMGEYIISDEQIAENRRLKGRMLLILPVIVRCRDCKHKHTVRHWLGMDVDECWLHADRESGALGKERTEPDGFCAWGERREQ